MVNFQLACALPTRTHGNEARPDQLRLSVSRSFLDNALQLRAAQPVVHRFPQGKPRMLFQTDPDRFWQTITDDDAEKRFAAASHP
jgi:hypothetical protein